MQNNQNNQFLIRFIFEFKHIYILIFAVSSCLRVIIPRIIEKSFAKLKDPSNYNKETSYFDMLANFTGDISVGFYILINLFRNKEKSSITSSEGVKTKKKMLIRFFIYLPLIAFIDFLAQLCLFSYSFFGNTRIHEKDLFFVVIIDIFFRYLFSRIFLKSYFYKHHIVSMVLNSIAFIPLAIINLKDIFTGDEYKESGYIIYIYLVLFLIMTILYSLEDVFNKIALNKLLLRPYELMFYKAVFQIIGIIVVSLIMKGKIVDYVKIQFSVGRIFYRLFFIICNIFRTISLITIIELINPNHLSILKSTEFIGLFIFIMIWSKTVDNKEIDFIKIILESFSLLLLLIGSIIHNEIIIINKWGLLECTDYYKTDIIGFTNIDVNIEEDKNNKKEDSLLGDSFD